MDLSVIIVSYNVRYYLELCLSSVRKASENIDHEVFVVDNNSADGSPAMVEELFPEVKLIRNTSNKGFSAANNQAILQASGKYKLLLNPDTIVEENSFSRCIDFMENHPDAGATGIMMINGSGKLLPESKRALPTPRTAFFKMSGLSWVFPRSGFFNSYYLGHLDNRKISKADIISGAFMFLRGAAIEKTGLLDEDFFMYGEDIDFSYRLLKAGYYNYYFPEVRVIHFKGESTDKAHINTIINFYKAMVIFVQKHFSDGTMKGFVHLIKAAIFLRGLLSLVRRSLARVFMPLTKLSDKSFYRENEKKERKTLIVSDKEEFLKITNLLSNAGTSNIVTGRISLSEPGTEADALDSLVNLRSVISSKRIKEVIFSAKSMRTEMIIDSMIRITDTKCSVRIAAENAGFIAGSRYCLSLRS